MHVGIDGSRCVQEKSTGVERYGLLLLPSLIAELKRRGHKVTVYSKENSSVFNGAVVKISGPKYLWSQLYLGLRAQLDGVDCLFVPSHVLPFIRPKKNVVFIHDICFEDFPNAYSFADRWYLRMTGANAARTSAVVTHSIATKERIEKIYQAKNVRVVKPAAIEVTKNEMPIAWPKPYLLFVGRIEIKKNLRILLEAYDSLLTKRPEIKHGLVLLGKDGYGTVEIKQYAGKLRHRDKIIFHGYAADGLRDQALREACGVVLPSICEGSSLVLLEARSARVPFAAGNCVACMEAGGDTGIYVKKNNVAGWISALEHLILKPFTPAPPPNRSWEDVANEVAEVITS